MSLIVETGAVVAGAESYVSVADATTYWAARNNADWPAATTAAQEAALRQACAYLDGAYRWQGTRIASTQALYWPRYLYVAEDGQTVPATSIPVPIKNAQCELALAALTGALAPERDNQKVSSEQVGSLSVSYFPGSNSQRTFPLVDLLLQDYTQGKTIGGLVANAVLA